MSGDPRVFFAAERTWLAWVRTGLSLMGFGFVVAKFTLFVRALVAEPAHVLLHVAPGTGSAGSIGILLVAAGGAMTGLTTLRHAHYVRTLPPEDVPHPRLSRLLPMACGICLTLLAFVLAFNLAQDG